MPSWNIHAAITKEILEHHNPLTLGITNTNHFTFGNLVPDIYVGYMVKDISHTHRYIQTHLTTPEHIPIPGAIEFWDTYIAPYIEKGGVESIVLGAWSHLETDAIFNRAVRRFNAAHDIQPGNETRIKKQADFHLFGNQLDMDVTIDADKNLMSAAENFSHYPIERSDVLSAIHAFEEAKRRSKTEPMTSSYLLLSRSFLTDTLQAAIHDVSNNLTEYAREVEAAGYPIGSPEQLSALKKNEIEACETLRPLMDIGPIPEMLFKDDEDRASIEYEIARMKDTGESL